MILILKILIVAFATLILLMFTMVLALIVGMILMVVSAGPPKHRSV